MNARAYTFFSLVLLFFVCGCASYAHNSGKFRRSLANNDYDSALKSLEDHKKGGNKLLHLMEKGLIAHYQGRYNESNLFFESAERMSDLLFARSISREAASLLTNDTVRAYRGEDFELVSIHYYRALNYWHLGLPEDALVECRKANLRLSRFVSDKNEPYRNDAFMHYLTGLFYEALGELNDAYISYQDAVKAYRRADREFGLRTPASLHEDLMRVTEQLDGTINSRIRLASLNLKNEMNGELVLFSEIGFVPRKVQKELNLPILEDDLRRGRRGELKLVSRNIARRYRTPYRRESIRYWLRVAIPTYETVNPKATAVRIIANENVANSVQAQNLASIAQATFRHKQPVILTRTVIRAFTKYLAHAAAKKKSKVLGFFTNLFAAATEIADTRSWVSLPHSIRIGRLDLKPGIHDITVETLDSLGNVLDQKVFSDIEIQSGERTFLNHRTFQ